MRTFWPILVLLLGGCAAGDDDTNGDDDDVAADDDVASDDDTGDDDTGDDDVGPGDDDVGPGDDDSSAGPTVTVRGVVTRSIAPTADANGRLYVTIFDPTLGLGPAGIVAANLADVDLSADGSSGTYSVPLVPAQAGPLELEAFLDEDDNGPIGGPTTGDLITGVRLPVHTDTPGDVIVDIVLDTRF